MSDEHMDKVLTNEQIQYWAENTPNNTALCTATNDGWDIIDWKTYYETVNTFSRSLIALGHKQDECVAIIAQNCVEFLYAQFGIVGAAGTPAPIYVTSQADQVAYILQHSKSRFVFIDEEIQYKKLVAQRDNIDIEKIILLEKIEDVDPEWTMSFEEFMKLGTEEYQEEHQKRLGTLHEEKTALLIYTSGTTGKPKAVILTQKNLYATGKLALERFSLIKTRVVSYLPLSHIAEQVITNIAQLYSGGEVYLCPSMKVIKEYLQKARPNVFLGVPRVWEKFAQAMQVQFDKTTGSKKKMLDWARKTELSYFDKSVEKGEEVSSFTRKLANKLVICKIKEKLGLDRIDVAVVGAAPIAVETMRFFASIGITIYEVYGMSETTGLITTTRPGEAHFGTVGKPFPGLPVKIAEDGEILAQGPTMSPGYLHDEENTAALWQNGWLHTGDIGKFDDRGNLVITGRKKNIIITAGGKNIAPLPIEQLLVAIPGIGIAVVIGDQRKYLSAALTIDRDGIAQVAKELDITFEKAEDLATNNDFFKYVEEKVKKDVNATLPQYQTIKKFCILPNDFSIETEELTPTMKVKRNVVMEKYKEEINKLY